LHDISLRNLAELADARIFIEMDGDENLFAVALMLDWPVKLAAGAIIKMADKATFVIGDYIWRGRGWGTSPTEILRWLGFGVR